MSIRKKARAATIAAGMVLTLALTGCTTTRDAASPAPANGTPASGTGGLPAVAAPQEVIAKSLDAMRGKKVQMITISGDGAPLTRAWRERAALGFKEVGVDFTAITANFDTQVLAQQVQTAIDQKPAALILHNADLSGLAKLIQQAQASGIYVIVMNLGSNAQSDAYIGPNWLSMVSELAERASSDCKAMNKKDVAIINGFGSDTGSLLTVEAATKTFKEQGMNLVASQPGQYDPTKANEITRTLMQQHPNLCAVLGNWDGMMTGAANAVAQAGKIGQVGVYTTDSSQVACDGIGKGTMAAAVNYGGGTTMGDNAVALTQYLLQSGLTPGGVKTALFTPTQIIDKTNYQRVGSCYAATAQ
ncbi:sugar ABC transporter substrate-binding protein [Streptosporangium sp. NBC_01755]|uniref:sugar ABC transporter substrate-binding protein n=1 Tax=unclassified Streptosporangium TaxID=2632669 RepID=UPI002DDC3290|nr:MULTISPECIES: sugar ABC transporter substrate-binding protein [unclassified Streptosporangium]WSA28293.1 sugar ABC transporter substrate-binding protein [Streptosporangium sp. NBC_01810]WSD00230.1 sugar ABC transporter substrate-binding protein [Streptosporangium sp. NBC_01755]